MPGTLTYEQVRQARVFAWHERHYLFVDDTLWRVVARYPSSDDEAGNPLAGMVIRPSALHGTEHLLDEGWHHLPGCSCRFCLPSGSEVGREQNSHGCSGGR